MKTAIRAKKSRLWHYEQPGKGGWCLCNKVIHPFERWTRDMLAKERYPDICPTCERRDNEPVE